MSAWLSMFWSHFDVSPILSLGKGALEDVPLGITGCVKFKYSPYPKYISSSSAHSSAPGQTRSQCHCTLLFALAGEGSAGSCPFSPGWPRNQGWRRKRRRCSGCSAQPFCGWLPLYSSGHWQGKVPWGFRSLQSALPARGSEFPTPALCLIHVLAAVTGEKGYAPPALGHPWPDVFGLSGAAKSPSWCSQCLYRHGLSRRKGSSAGRCMVQTFLSRQSSMTFEVS